MSMIIDKPGCYQLPMRDYVRDPVIKPSLSASIAHILTTQSPLHAWITHPRLNPNYHPREESRFDIGSVAHQLLLQGDRSNIVTVEADDWRTKAAKETRDSARAQGKVAVLANQMEDIQAMVKEGQKAIVQSEVAGAFNDGQPEQTLVIEEGGNWLRCRPDWLANDHKMIVDYKTTAGTAMPSGWVRNGLLANGYDLQAAINLLCVQRLYGIEDCQFVFMVQECEPPYAVSFLSLEPRFLAFAQQKLAAAITLWQTCLSSGKWPGYSKKICYAELPVYAEMQFAERQGLFL